MPLKKFPSKVFLLLASLTEEELEDFKRFLCMPFSHASQTLRALLDYCIPLYPDFEDSAVRKEVVHGALFEKAPFKEKRIRDLFSDLSLKLKDYLIWRGLNREEGMREAILVRELQWRGLGEFARQEGNRCLHQWNEATTLMADRQLYGFKIQDVLFSEDDSQEELLLGAQESLDVFFVLAKLRLSAILLYRRGYLAGSQEIRFWEEINRQASEGQWQEPVGLYLQILKLLSSDFDEVAFRAAVQSYREKASLFSPEDKRILFQGLINTALRVINEQDASFVRESWELYKMGLESGSVLSEKGELNDTTFTNIVINGAKIGEFDWTARFIESYSSRLSSDIRDNAVALGQAFWHYNKRDFDRVIEVLRDVKYSSVAYALRGRSLLLRTYFDKAIEQGYTFSTEFYYHTEAFLRYVQRNKELSENRRQAYLHFISFTKSLARVAAKEASPKTLEGMQQKIDQAQQLIAKDWLLERIETIKKN